ncbi:hypothetical protein QE152_g33831 [Popillia japonica]|uniref:ARHGAP20 PH domain-containing protein n=1 Tax=Popillia japonica TaxID=7064 RepID=A0AAW1IVK5_POPJA
MFQERVRVSELWLAPYADSETGFLLGHLFLFSDLLLVAKPRNGGTFKLKERVRVSELWLAPYADSETGFLLDLETYNQQKT